MRQILDVVVERPQPPGDRILQQLLEPSLGFACEDRHTEVHHLLNAGIPLRQHREGAGYMEAADRNVDAELAKLPRQIERSGKLVGLDPDQHHHADLSGLDRARQIRDAHLPVGLIDGVDLDVAIGPENPAFATIERDAVKASQ